MKKLNFVFALLLIFVSNYGTAQIIGHPKKYGIWKQSKLYVVKTVNEEINTALENSAKASFPNFAGSVSEAEAEKLMDNENNFLITIVYPGTNMIKQNNWDKFNFGIGIFQANAKKIHRIEYYKDFLIRQEFTPIAPSLNVGMYASEARDLYIKDGSDKTFKPESNIAAMVPVTLHNFKRILDAAVDLPGDKSDKKTMEEVSVKFSQDAKLLKKKTLLVLNTSFTEEFYNAYAFKKERVEKNDLSKLKSKNKDYCFLQYTVDTPAFVKQISVIDCETLNIIYTYSTFGSAKLSPMSKVQAQDLNDAVNGKVKAQK